MRISPLSAVADENVKNGRKIIISSISGRSMQAEASIPSIAPDYKYKTDYDINNRV